MPTWDVFHSDRLEVERGLDDAAVRAALARGDLTEDDLIRPAGAGSPWARLGDRDDRFAQTIGSPPDPIPPEPEPEPEPGWLDPARSDFEAAVDEGPSIAEPMNLDYEQVDPEASLPAMLAFADDRDDEQPPEADDEDGIEILEADDDPAPARSPGRMSGPILPPYEKTAAIPVPGPSPLPFDEAEIEVEFDGEDEYDPVDDEGDEEADEFTLARGSAETVEELDLAAMVDVAFQLVLFFLVTATTILYKSLEVPAPKADAPPEAAQQARGKTLDEMMNDNILVEIDAAGGFKIDRQPFPSPVTMATLADKLRALRTETGRTAMLVSTDYNTPHRIAVIAIDAANEIGIGIKLPTPGGPKSVNAPAPASAASKGG